MNETGAASGHVLPMESRHRSARARALQVGKKRFLTPASSITERPDSGERSVRASLTAQSSDAELARALMEGDPAAPPLAWRRFLPLIKYQAAKAFVPRHEIEDVIQTTFLALFRGIHALRDPHSLAAFVQTIARRTLNVERRRRYQRGKLVVALQVSGLPTREHRDAWSRHAYVHFQGLLQRLNPRDRLAFELRYVQRWESAEVASALGVSEPTARRASSRARARMLVWASRNPFLNELAAAGPESVPSPVPHAGAAA